MARLARLRLSDAQAEALTRQLEAVLGYVAMLDEPDTAGVAPTAHVLPAAAATPLRADAPGAALTPEQALANAPAARGSAFTVPGVLASEDEG